MIYEFPEMFFDKSYEKFISYDEKGMPVAEKGAPQELIETIKRVRMEMREMYKPKRVYDRSTGELLDIRVLG